LLESCWLSCLQWNVVRASFCHFALECMTMSDWDVIRFDVEFHGQASHTHRIEKVHRFVLCLSLRYFKVVIVYVMMVKCTQCFLYELCIISPPIDSILRLMTVWSTTGKIIISATCELSEHQRRLWDWPFCPFVTVSVIRSVYMMTHNGSDIIAPTAQASMLAVTFAAFPVAALCSSSSFLVISCTCRCFCICRCSSSSSNV